MEHLYYLNHAQFHVGDTTTAFNFARELLKNNDNIDTITFLVKQQRLYSAFLGELGFTAPQIRAHGFNQDGVRFQIHTVATYHPNYAFNNDQKCEILIVVGVPPKEIEAFLDRSRVKYWIVVPWVMDENLQFLHIYEAENLETGEILSMNYEIDARIKGAIEWLKSTSYPNEGYHHPNDENRLKSMANAIRHYNIPFEHDSLIHYCIHNGLTFNAAKKTVEYFEKAAKRKFSVKDGYKPETLLKQMERIDWPLTTL